MIAESGTSARLRPTRPAWLGKALFTATGWKCLHLVAERLAGKPGCRILYIRCSGTPPPLLHPDRTGPPLQFRFRGAEEPCLDGVPHEHATTLNKRHGRIERRKCWTISDPASLQYLDTSGE